MSRGDDLNRSSDATLAAALRALPQAAPEPDLWPELARTLSTSTPSTRRWRYALPAALAAAVAIAVLAPRFAPHDAPAPTSVTTAATPVSTAVAPIAPTAATEARSADEVAQLRDRSGALERWIAAVAARAPQDGRDLMAAVEVEDLIGLVDVQLGGARGNTDALPLWRQRVALLEDLAAIRSNAFALAENGADATVMPASSNPLN